MCVSFSPTYQLCQVLQKNYLKAMKKIFMKTETAALLKYDNTLTFLVKKGQP